ncbi:uncharacterized protein LOC113505330 [Trichoplusia ni]|uniref:Uncharacterized protein LOC113505330 n=1 Tax=Trichoplusia ni TaxID=7111 RepID=A0A7E5WT62_TRINI|nr:uncharacterized protein LOC113505330 [Trichoplusia ni]
MAINGCSSGLVVTAVVALLLLPAQYYVPDLYAGVEDPLTSVDQPESPPSSFAWFDLAFVHLPPLDLFVTVTLLLLGLFTYLCEWIQRKLMERRIVKLNQYLGASVERLRAWDAQQEQLEVTLKMVQNATSEYNLLLYLLLRQHRCLAGHNGPPSNCFFDKGLDDDLNFLRNPTLDA